MKSNNIIKTLYFRNYKKADFYNKLCNETNKSTSIIKYSFIWWRLCYMYYFTTQMYN